MGLAIAVLLRLTISPSPLSFFLSIYLFFPTTLSPNLSYCSLFGTGARGYAIVERDRGEVEKSS